MKKLHKLLVSTTAIVRVSKLIAISLLCLVGCSAEPSNKNESDLKNTGVTESDISGCWVRSKFTDHGNGYSSYWKDTYKLEPRGSYTGESTNQVTGVSPASRTFSGKWIIDDGYVVIQERDRDTSLTLKIISKHELIQVGDSTGLAFRRC